MNRSVHHRLAVILGAVAFAIGAIALAGWIFDVEQLKRVHPSLVNMKANTAICLMFASVSLILQCKDPVPTGPRKIAQFCAMFIAAVGVLTLSEHLFRWDLGIDQFLFSESEAEAGMSFPGRMGVAACLSFFFLGTALFLLDRKLFDRYLANGFVMAASTTVLLVFLYYFYGVEEFERVSRYATIALHTVVAFSCLCAGILLARPTRGVMAVLLGHGAGSVVARRMLPALVLIVLLGWLRNVGRDAGWFGPSFGTAALVLAIILILGSLIWWTAASLNRTDAARREAERNLRTNEERLRTLVNETDQQRRFYDTILSNTPDLVYVFDRKHRFTYANKALLQMWGKTWEEAIGKTCLELGYERWHAEMHDREIEEVIATRKPIRGEVPFTGTSGRRVYDYIFVPVINAQGEAEAVAGTTRDVTERNRAEEALRRSEERFRAFVTATSDLVYSMSADWSEMRHLDGRKFIADTSDPSRMWLERYIHPDEQPRVLAAIQEAIEKKKAFELEHRVVRVDGSLGWTFSRAIPLLDDKGNLVEWFGAARDITERMQAEETLRRSNERFRIATETGKVGVWEWDIATNRVTWTDSLFTLHGVRKQEFVPTLDTFASLLHPEDKEIVSEAIQRSLTDGAPYALTFRAVKPGGEVVWLFTNAAVLRHGGMPQRMIGATVDVTERKRAEEILERTVRERTAALQESHEQMETFTYTVAHDLRAPLRAQHAFAKALLDDFGEPLGQTGRHYAERIIYSATRLNELVGDLLAYSRISRSELTLEKIELGRLVDDICHELEFQILESRARLHIENCDYAVRGHSVTARTAITNLLTNALKFTEKGTVPKVRIHAEPRGEFVRLWVEDNGIGIAPEHHHQIFGVFHRLHKVGEYPGNGVGLAIVKKGIERMGGRVGMESQAGVGSRFWVELKSFNEQV